MFTSFFLWQCWRQMTLHSLKTTSPWEGTIFIDHWNLKLPDIEVLFLMRLFLYHLIISALNLPLGSLSRNKTVGIWQVAVVNSCPSHSTACHDTNDGRNPSFKCTHFFLTSKNVLCGIGLSSSKEHTHNNLYLTHHFFSACLILSLSDNQKSFILKTQFWATYVEKKACFRNHLDNMANDKKIRNNSYSV